MAALFDKFVIAPYKNGLNTDQSPWLIPDDAFERLDNAYVFRGKVRKRFGTKLTGYAELSEATKQLNSRLRVPLYVAVESLGDTNGGGDISGTVAGGYYAIGQTFKIGQEIFTVTALGTPGVMTTTGAATTHTFNTTTGAFVIVASEATTAAYFDSNKAVVTNSDTSIATTGTVPGSSFTIGQTFSIGTEIFTVYQDGTLHRSSGDVTASHACTFNTTTGAYRFIYVEVDTQIYFYPSQPVMALTQYEETDKAIAFDQQFAYQYTGSAWERLKYINATWHSSNSKFFWTTNWANISPATKYLIATNFNATVGAPGANDDPIKYYNGTAWTDFIPKFLVAGDAVASAKLIIPFKNRLVFLSTIETNAAGTLNSAHENRCRFSRNGSPFNLDISFLEQNQVGSQGAGWIDASTDEAIVSAGFIRDKLIVYFERSTWELSYTGNEAQPFLWSKLNNEQGSQSMKSTVPFDKALITVGERGITGCTGTTLERLDNKIPDEIFDIRTTDNGPLRVAGIRDFTNEMVYWTFPNNSEDINSSIFTNKVLVFNYKNGNWSFNDDCFTAFGYYQQQEGAPWSSLTDFKWAQWAKPWDSGSAQPAFKQIVAGNQQGYVVKIDPNVTTNASALQITDIAFDQATGLATLKIMNHTLGDDTSDNMDVIKLLNCTIDITVTAGGALVESKNIDDFYEMSIAGVNTVTIDPKFSAALRNPLYTYTCHGGATVARVSRIDILSKEWNFYLPEARSIYLSQIDFIIKRTSAGKITIDYFPSTSNISMIDAAKASKSSLGTNILETGAYADLPFEATFKRLSHRIYFQAEGTCVQIRIFLNDEQMVVSATAECDFQLEGMIISASRTSDFE